MTKLERFLSVWFPEEVEKIRKSWGYYDLSDFSAHDIETLWQYFSMEEYDGTWIRVNEERLKAFHSWLREEAFDYRQLCGEKENF